MGVHEKLLKVQGELKAPKSQYNSFGKYNYRSCEDILEAVKPLLISNKLTLVVFDDVVLTGDRYYIRATARVTDIEDGKTVESVAYAREDETKKGMDLAQVTGSVSSYARKYALNGLFCIDDNKDSDTTNTHGKAADKPKASNNTNEIKVINEAQLKRLYAIANKAGYDADKIKGMIKTKYNKELKDLTKAEYDHICNGLEVKANG